jgi:hypothetical protein
VKEPEKIFGIDAEYLSGRRFPYQEDISLVEDVDLIAATPVGELLRDSAEGAALQVPPARTRPLG